MARNDDPVRLLHECGHLVIRLHGEKPGPHNVIFEAGFNSAFTARPEEVEPRLKRWLTNFDEIVGNRKMKRGRKSILTDEEVEELRQLHDATRPRDHGIGYETRYWGDVWTVDLFLEVMRRRHPGKTISRATAGRYLRYFGRAARKKGAS